MKKLLVLSVLLGLMALPMFASDITFGGDATFGFIGDFGDAEGEKTDLTFDIKAAIDDYSSLTINVDGAETLTLGGISKALVTTDVGTWVGLPVGLVVSWGYDDPDANEFQSISGYGNEEIFNFSPKEYWGFDFLLSYNIIEVEVAFNPGVATNPADFGYLLAGLAVKEPVAGLNAEAYWFQNESVATDTFDTGQIGIDAAYSTEVAGIGLDAGVGFMYDMDDAATDAWAWGLGLAASVSMFDITVGLDGNETDVFQELSASVEIAPVDMATLYVGVDTDFAEAATETLQGADIGVNLHIGAVEAYLGYLITTVGAGEYNADFGDVWSLDGGMYVKFDVDY